MAWKLQMTWVPARKGWLVHHKGRMHSVSCRQMGTEPTKEASWRAANQWWEKKQAEIDARAEVAVEDPRSGERATLATMAALRELERSGSLPTKVGVDLGDDRGEVIYSLGAIRNEAEARAAQAIAALDGALVKADTDRTVGGRAVAWYASIMAAVDAGRVNISRWGEYRRNLEIFVGWAGPGSGIEILTASRLSAFYGGLAGRVASGRYAPDYARSIVGAVKQFLTWLAEEDMIPLPGNIRSPKFRFGKGNRASRADLFTPDEVQRVLAAAGDRLRLFLLFMLNCGMYHSDISNLGDDEVDWEAGTIGRHRSKNDARFVTYKLWPETFELLKRCRHRGEPVPNERGSARVLLTGDGKPLTAYWIEGGQERRYDTIQGL